VEVTFNAEQTKKGGLEMKRAILIGFLIMILAVPVTSWAGMKLKISDDTQIDLGFRVQTQFIATNDNNGGAGESEEKFQVRRARFRLGGSVTEYVKFFMQTDLGSGSEDPNGQGTSVQMIDAMVNLHYKNLINVIMGQFMAPAGRQITTSSGALMAIDRPNITNYNLTWGLNGKVGFNTGPNFAQGNLNISNDVFVRDQGVTLFSSYSFSDTLHGKAYLGVYDGIDNTKDELRLTARAQVNFFDPEPGYFNLSTYLGKKKTVGIGASYDYQSDFAFDDSKGWVDYNWFELDAFMDYPVGPGFLTAEVAFQNLDLDSAKALHDSPTTGIAQNAKETQGNGLYGQIGYYLEDWQVQPWAGIDYWDSDGSNDIGSFTSYRIGLTYFFKGHNANVKMGYERFEAEEKVAGQHDDIDTFVTAFYVTF
jgi:hypothetical protein